MASHLACAIILLGAREAIHVVIICNQPNCFYFIIKILTAFR